MANLINLFQPKTESRVSALSSSTSFSESPFHAYRKAKADFYADRLPSALRTLDQILECESARRRDIIDALLLRGEVRCIQNDHNAGYADFRAALAIDPRNPRISNLLRNAGAPNVETQPDVSPAPCRSHGTRKKPRPYSEQIIPEQAPPKQIKNVGRRTQFRPPPPAPPPIRLPFEILSMIAVHSPFQTLKAWLSVSRLHRAVAHGLLFNSVNIYFRSPEPGVPLGDVAICSRQIRRAKDVLERIASDAAFAKNIFTLRICGYSSMLGHEGLWLQAMENLVSLKSLCISQSELESSVVQQIVKKLPHLQDLSFGRNAVIPAGLAAIFSLQRVSLWSIPNSLQNQATAQLMFQSNVDTLRCLEIGAPDGGEAWLLKSTNLSRLTSLSYCDGRLSSTTLDMILTQAPNLEHLTLHAKPIHMFTPAPLFKANATGLVFPNLRTLSLRINDSFALDLGLFNGLMEFIRDRPCLEMLAIQDFSGANRMVVAGLGGCLATLPRLKALKLSGRYLKGGALLEVLSHLPKSVEALAIGTSLTPDDLSFTTQLENLLPHFRSLRGLFIQPISEQSRFRSSNNTVTDQAIRLAGRLENTEFIGMNGVSLSVRRGVGGTQVEPLEPKKVDPVIDWVLEWRSKDLDFVLQ